MSNQFPLNETRSPIDPNTWDEMNENWDRIRSYLRFLERQIKFLAGGNEIDDILLRIDTAIANAESATADVNQAKQEIEMILSDLTTLVSSAEAATNNANTAASNANSLTSALTSLKTELETLQTNLNGIVQAEAQRLSNETNRTNAEQVRATDETTRRENEAARVLKEQSRETAEQNRTSTFDAQMLTAEQKITMMQYLIDNLKSYDFDLNATYNFPNLIKWNGSTFITLQEVTGLTPVDDGINYRLVAQRGVDGTGAVSSVNGNGPDANGNVEVIMALVNNLVSDSTSAGLTAAQGKVLKVLLDSLQQAFNSHVNDIDNPHGVTAEQLALGNLQNFGIATQVEAEDGTSTTKYMTPQRTKQAVDKALGPADTHMSDQNIHVTKAKQELWDRYTIQSAIENMQGTVKTPNQYRTQSNTGTRSGTGTVFREFNNNTTLVGMPPKFAMIETIVPWTDSSGGVVNQTAYGSDGGVYRRIETSAGSNTWGAWGMVVTSVNGRARTEYNLYTGSIEVGTVNLSVNAGFPNLKAYDEVIVFGITNNGGAFTFKRHTHVIVTSLVSDIYASDLNQSVLFLGGSLPDHYWLRYSLDLLNNTLSINYNRAVITGNGTENPSQNYITRIVGVKYA
ncbi:MAG: hypothetical protein ABS917_11390 [Solibacillus sp.]|uniref:hypothetical protein n=1 Tax=Solibacillus sp. TaxID=1909654 RepID=UPI0033152192